MAEGQQMPHRLILDERKKLTITGVSEVVSFDESSIVLQTTLGLLRVFGQNLHLKQLTPEGGNVSVEGNIDHLGYEEQRAGGSWLGRLFG